MLHIPTNEKQGIINTNTSSNTQARSSNNSSNSQPAPASNNSSSSNSQSNSNTGNTAMASIGYNNAKKVDGGYEVTLEDKSQRGTPVGHGIYTYPTYTQFIPDSQVTNVSERNTPLGHGIVSTSYDLTVDNTPKADSGAGTGNMYIDPAGDYGQAIIGASEISYPDTAETERFKD